ncbi:cell envelope integrity protein TolA, partial [Thiolapillus sp.]
MLDLIRRHPLGFTLAVLMHVAIVLLMIFGLDWLNPPEIQKPTGQVVQARLVDTEQFARQKEIKHKTEKRQTEQKHRQEEKKKEE